MSATDAASPSVVVSNLFIIPKPGINIGFAIVYQEISISVFLVLECVESRSTGPGHHSTPRMTKNNFERKAVITLIFMFLFNFN